MGRFLPVIPGLYERLFLGVKESFSICNFVLGDNLKRARSKGSVYECRHVAATDPY